MLRHALIVAMLFVSASVQAFDTYRFDNRIVEVGDSAGKLIELAGEPVLKEPIENKFGAVKGERWQYVRNGITVTFVISDGKIGAIEQVHN